MQRLIRSLAISAAVLSACFLAPAHAEPQHAPAPVATAQVAAPEGLARPALWKVSDEDTTIYLFGTIHALPDSIEWMDGPVAKAFSASQVLVTEIPETPPSTMQAIIMKTAMLPPGQSLHAILPPEDAKALDAALTNAGLPPLAFDRYEPWFAAVTVATLPLLENGYTQANGVEAQLSAMAKADKRPQEGLETAEYQLGLFDALPRETQIRYLREVLDSLPEMSSELDKLVAYWSLGDPVKLAEVMNADEDDPEMIEILLTQRNRNWAKWIKQRLDKPGSVFIAVGAGHLAGDGSVQDQLEKLGIATARVQ